MFINTLCFRVTLLTYLIYPALFGFTHLSSLSCLRSEHIIEDNYNNHGLDAVFGTSGKGKLGVRGQLLRHQSRSGVRTRMPGNSGTIGMLLLTIGQNLN